MGESKLIISALLINYRLEIVRDSSIRNINIMVIHPDAGGWFGIVLDTPIE